MPRLLATGRNEPFYICVLRWSSQITIEMKPELSSFLEDMKAHHTFLYKSFCNILWCSKFFWVSCCCGERCPVGVVRKIMQLLKNEVLASWIADTTQNKTKPPRSLYSSNTGVLWVREAIFDLIKHLVSWLPSRMSELLMVSIATSMGIQG